MAIISRSCLVRPGFLRLLSG